VLFGRLPRVGEKVFYADYEITVKEVSGMRITKVRVSRGRTPDEPEETPDEPLDMESLAEPVAEDLQAGAPADQEQEALDDYESDLLNEPTEAEAEAEAAAEAAADHGTEDSQAAGKAASAAN
jgi:hypothetical protein